MSCHGQFFAVLALILEYPIQSQHCISLSKGGLRRHFRIMNNVTKPIESTTGVPEGCGFSVCCMMQLNWIVTSRLQEESQI